MKPTRLDAAFAAFDEYNSKDPNKEVLDGEHLSKELLYAQRMTETLFRFQSDANEHIQLAARAQHIGRWEIPRATYPMDRKGYLQWRTKLAQHHASLAGKILAECGYDNGEIEKVKFLLQKKELHRHHAETQLLEDVICLVFIKYYLEEFALRHDDDKVVDILRKTIRKMSPRALTEVGTIPVSSKMKRLIAEASTG
jgi:hypothetical protein